MHGCAILLKTKHYFPRPFPFGIKITERKSLTFDNNDLMQNSIQEFHTLLNNPSQDS